jgi:hypothetical protein
MRTDDGLLCLVNGTLGVPLAQAHDVRMRLGSLEWYIQALEAGATHNEVMAAIEASGDNGVYALIVYAYARICGATHDEALRTSQEAAQPLPHRQW